MESLFLMCLRLAMKDKRYENNDRWLHLVFASNHEHSFPSKERAESSKCSKVRRQNREE